MISVKYDVMVCPDPIVRGKYSEEISLICDFDKSNHTNMCFECDSRSHARVLVETIHRYRKALALNVKITQRDNLVYIYHKEVK